MKKRLISILSIFIITVSVLCFGIYIYLFSPDEDIDAQLNKQFSEEFFNFSDLHIDESNSIAADTTITNDKSSNVIQTESNLDNTQSNQIETTDAEKKSIPKDKTTVEPTKQDSSLNKSQSTIPTDNSIQKPTVSSIENEYLPKFKKLEQTAVARLDELFSVAYKEYKEGIISKNDLAKKYIHAGEKLQNGVDGVFYGLINQMKEELVANDLPLDLVKEAESTYIDAIKKKKREFLNKL